jgi:hypothetical protein
MSCFLLAFTTLKNFAVSLIEWMALFAHEEKKKISLIFEKGVGMLKNPH